MLVVVLLLPLLVLLLPPLCDDLGAVVLLRTLVHTEAHRDDTDASAQAVNTCTQRRRGSYKCSKCAVRRWV